MQYRRVHEAALAADPNVYDYDSFHDGYQEARAAAEIKKHEDEKSGPKYIFALLAAQKQRDREQNVTYERTLARDRAAEDAMHGDKDVYVTSAYKKKLQEDELWQAQQEAKCAFRSQLAESTCKFSLQVAHVYPALLATRPRLQVIVCEACNACNVRLARTAHQ